MAETTRRREKQAAFNQQHGITPQSIMRGISDILDQPYDADAGAMDHGLAQKLPRSGKEGGKGRSGNGAGTQRFSGGSNLRAVIAGLEKDMRAAAADLEFERAALLRDELKRMQALELAYGGDASADDSSDWAAAEAAAPADADAAPAPRSVMGRAGGPRPRKKRR